MTVAISLLRGINVGGHHLIPMAALRALYEELGVRQPQTYLQSGNVVFRASARDLARLGGRLEAAIENRFGFRPDVMIRTAAELRDVIARNPFATRRGIEPAKLAVLFLARDPGAAARGKLRGIDTGPEELRIHDRELYIYFPNGMGRPKLSAQLIEKTLETPGTARNWNTVTRLAEMAEKLEG